MANNPRQQQGSQQVARRPQQQPAARDQREAEQSGRSRYADDIARVIHDLESDTKTIAGLLKAEPGSSEFGQFVNEVQLAITKAYKKDGSNPLLEATPASFRSAVREAAGFGYSLNPRLGEAYLIPRSGVVEMQSGYKGLNKLAWRSGILSSLHAECVYKGEPYKRFGGTERPRIEHEPDDTGIKRTNKWPDILCAYATAFVGDSKHAIFQVAPRWRLSLARGSGTTDAWKGHPDAMCRKTALIMLASEMPRHDKLRDFHLAVEREVQFELDETEFTVAIRDDSDEASEEWLKAVEAYALLGIEETGLLGFLGIDNSTMVTDEHLDTLRKVYTQNRSGKAEAMADVEKMRVGPQAAVEAPATEGHLDVEPDASARRPCPA